MKETKWIDLAIILMMISLFLFIVIYKFYSRINTDKEIHKHSIYYIHETIEHVQRLRIDYEESDNQKRKKAIRQLILNNIATIDISEFPPSLREWIEELQLKPPKF